MLMRRLGPGCPLGGPHPSSHSQGRWERLSRSVPGPSLPEAKDLPTSRAMHQAARKIGVLGGGEVGKKGQEPEEPPTLIW